MEPADFVAALRGAAPYVHAHNGRVFVIAFGGEAALRPDFEQLIYDIALLHSLGVKLVLVHGVRPQIEAQLAARGASRSSWATCGSLILPPWSASRPR
jgi:amino-acid N-acetyltransferase